MRELRTYTTTRVTVGPFIDVTDGVTPLLSLTVTNCHLTLIVDTAGVPTLVLDTAPTASGGNNDMVHITGDDAGYFDLELLNDNVNYLGRAMLAIVDDNVHLPVFHEFSIVTANYYDTKYGTDQFDIPTATQSTIDAIIALLDDARGEPGDTAPPVNPDLATKIDYLYKFMRNKVETVTATGRIHVYSDSGLNKDHSSVISDDGDIFTRGEFGAGDA